MKIRLVIDEEIFNCSRKLLKIGDLWDELESLGIKPELQESLNIFFIDEENDKIQLISSRDLDYAQNSNQKILKIFVTERKDGFKRQRHNQSHLGDIPIEQYQQQSVDISAKKVDSQNYFFYNTEISDTDFKAWRSKELEYVVEQKIKWLINN